MSQLRGWLYRWARLLGDVNAVEKGRVPKRIGRRIAGRYTARALNRLFH